MKLSTKGRYAVMAICDLAEGATGNGGRPISLSDIAKRQNISISYLEQLFANMRRANLVKSVRGPGGGYVLARPTSDIQVSEIMLSVDTPLHRGNKGSAEDPASDPTIPLWSALESRLIDFLSDISVEDVLQRRVPGAMDDGSMEAQDVRFAAD